ncbi:MAG: acyltransferase domain-containing protein, partial [Myxococcota bacterium]
ADLDGPIVHGLWSAARCTAFVVDHAADGDATRITHSRVQFLAPVAPGSPIELKAVRRSLKDGARNIEVTLSTSEGIAVRGTWTVAPYKVAYVFPGQGIQRPGMGMDGYARSRAAKRVWEAADRVSRDKLGFSLLRVVRDNPTELRLPEGQVRHPEGVLHLTQFTQVAMATLAMAQIQELDEAGALIPGATFCGHSVGEYAALAAYGRVLPLEAVIELVWRRGLTMHTLVPRDEHGESGYRMGVVRPHHAGLPAEQVEGLLEEVRAETGGFVEIVNYNVRGRQYAVTGETKTLRVLEKRLMARQKGKKAPWLLVPGIDVPFHSTALVPGVDAFRDKLNRCMPQEVDVASLIGRYVPNLVARPFELTRPFALAILEVVDAQIVRDLLDRWDEAMADRNAVARILLIELLAWQFASPVRWIETQDLLLQPAWRKGLGLDTIIEIGVGYQPTLANMAKQTRVALGIDMPVLHVEADRDLVFSQDTDLPEPVAAPEVEASAEPAAAPVAEAAPAPVVAPTGPVGAPPEVAPGTAEVLRWMIALQSKRRLDQLSHLETLEEIFDGVSSRVNQLLLDVGQELGVGAIDGAAQLPLGELITTMESKVRYRGPGPYRTARHDAACAQVLGPCGWSKRDLEQHLATTFQFGEGLVSDALDELVTGTREGTSTAGGDLGGLPTRAADVAEAKALARQLAERLAARHGFGLAGPSTGGAAAAVDAEALNELRSELAGPQGVLTRAAQALGQMSLEETPLPESNSDTSVLEPEVERALQPAFHPEQHVALTSGWAWAHSAVVRYALHGEGDAGRLVTWGGDTAVGRTAAWYADRVPERQEMLEAIAAGGEARCVDWTPVRPGPEGDRPEGTRETFVRDLTERDVGHLATTWKDLLLAGADSAWSFAGRTALVTGAGPTSLATDVVRHLLRGGARVIVTTSSYRRARVALYQKLFAAEAGPGAELHIVPFNQASMTDISALISHLEGRGLLPDLLLPFAAIKDLGTLDTLGPRAEVALRAMLLGPERMIGGLAARFKALGRGDALQVIVPLSPNLGTFGGDGVYAETKAALQTLEAKWHSEHDAWGRHTSLVPVRIGWVRGTALMDANDS